MEKHVTLESGCKIARLVDKPELVKVLVIKAKFVDQMEKVKYPMPEGLAVVGTTGGWVILRKENGHLIRAHRMDWMDHLTFHAGDQKTAREEANQQLDGYSQLFES